MELVRMAFRGEADEDAVVRRGQAWVGVTPGLTGRLNREMRVEGLGLTVKVYTLQNTSGRPDLPGRVVKIAV